jgi:hypothetical protein
MRRPRITQYLIWIAVLTASVLGAAPALAAAPAALADAVRAYAQQITAPSFDFALVDLDDDGNSDALVLLKDPNWCGTGGCTLLILRGKGGGLQSAGG